MNAIVLHSFVQSSGLNFRPQLAWGRVKGPNLQTLTLGKTPKRLKTTQKNRKRPKTSEASETSKMLKNLFSQPPPQPPIYAAANACHRRRCGCRTARRRHHRARRSHCSDCTAQNEEKTKMKFSLARNTETPVTMPLCPPDLRIPVV